MAILWFGSFLPLFTWRLYKIPEVKGSVPEYGLTLDVKSMHEVLLTKGLQRRRSDTHSLDLVTARMVYRVQKAINFLDCWVTVKGHNSGVNTVRKKYH